MRLSRRQALTGSLALGLVGRASAVARPASFADTDARARAARRGLKAIYRSSLAAKAFAADGEDYLWAFYNVAVTAADPTLSDMALRMGEERARHWRRLNPHVPAKAGAGRVYLLAAAARCADRLIEPDPRMHEGLARAAARFTADDFLSFDPTREAPPSDVPETCDRCGHDNARGATRCRYCGERLTMQSPYDVFSTALIVTYVGESYGVRLGASFPDVIACLPDLRPFHGYDGGRNDAFDAEAYAVTHVVYTLNDYSVFRLSPAWLPQEFAFLNGNIDAVTAAGDGELLGEFLDTLKSFGRTGEDDAQLGRAEDYLLRTQHRDGSWGDQPYHPTWTAVDGLRDYAFRGEGVSFPAALARARA
jgi:hypothetical protein